MWDVRAEVDIPDLAVGFKEDTEMNWGGGSLRHLLEELLTPGVVAKYL